MADTQRISIGFQASPPIALRVPQDELDKLDAAPSAARAGTTSRARTARCSLSLQNVLWVRVEKDEQRVGFGLT